MVIDDPPPPLPLAIAEPAKNTIEKILLIIMYYATSEGELGLQKDAPIEGSHICKASPSALGTRNNSGQKLGGRPRALSRRLSIWLCVMMGLNISYIPAADGSNGWIQVKTELPEPGSSAFL